MHGMNVTGRSMVVLLSGLFTFTKNASAQAPIRQLNDRAVMEPPAFHPRGASQLAEKTADSHGEPDSDGLRELVRRRCAICLVAALLSLLVSVHVFWQQLPCFSFGSNPFAKG